MIPAINKTSPPISRALVKTTGADRLQYQMPDEWRLDQSLQQLTQTVGVPVELRR